MMLLKARLTFCSSRSGGFSFRLLLPLLFCLCLTQRAAAILAVADQAVTAQNAAAIIPVLANDSDSTNQLAILRVTPPAHGTVSVNSGSPVTTPELTRLFQFAARQLSNTVAQIGDTNLYPRYTLADGTWELRSLGPNNWISGFLPGALWYLHEQTGDAHFRLWAESWTAGNASEQFLTETDDLGFIINNSVGHGYRLTGNPAYEPVLVQAAQSVVAVRYNPVAGCIGDTFSDRTLGVISDSMMNIELLFRAAALSGDTNLYAKAFTHAERTMLDFVRPDGSTWHGVIYATNGAVLSKGWRAGTVETSTWARGHAWATYGFTMAYRETGDARFLNTAQRLVDYYLATVPTGYVPYWDNQAPGIPNVLKDSSAAAITLSALLELSQLATNSADAARDWNAARHILDSLASTNYLAQGTASSGILLHGVGSDPPSEEADVSLIYADYYFVETLRRLAETYRRATVTYVPEPGFLGTDVFSYQACDSVGDCAIGTVTVTVGFAVQISLSPVTHQPIISFPTSAGKNYFVQYRNDLGATGAWSVLATNIAGSGSIFSITDTNLPGQRFYRVGVE